MSEEKEQLNEHFKEDKKKKKISKRTKTIGISLLIITTVLFVLMILKKDDKEPNNDNTENSKQDIKQTGAFLQRDEFRKAEMKDETLSDYEKEMLNNKILQDSIHKDNLNQYSRLNNYKEDKLKNDGNNKLNEVSKNASAIKEPKIPYKYKPSNVMKKRMDSDYQSIVRAFKGNLEQNSWRINESKYIRFAKRKDSLNKIEEPLKNLYDGADKEMVNNTSVLNTGTRILSVTEQDINSDYPSLFTAKVIRPFELKGMKLLCESGENLRGRIPCKIVKLIDKKKTEYTVSGQIEMNGIAGMEGRVRNNWHKRLGPSLINATIGGGFIAWQMSNDVDSIRVDSRDAVYGPIVQQSVEGLQSEISRLGGDYPNTVLIPKGKEFTILLTNSITLEI